MTELEDRAMCWQAMNLSEADRNSDLLHFSNPPHVRKNYYVWNLGILGALVFACTLDWGYTWRAISVLITLCYGFTFLRTAFRRLRSPPPLDQVARFAEYLYADDEQRKELDRLKAERAIHN